MIKVTKQTIKDAIYYNLVDNPTIYFTLNTLFNAIYDIKGESEWLPEEYNMYIEQFFNIAEQQNDVELVYVEISMGNSGKYIEPILYFKSSENIQNFLNKNNIELNVIEKDFNNEFSNQKALRVLEEILNDKKKYTWFNLQKLISASEIPLTLTIIYNRPDLFKALVLNASYDDLLAVNTNNVNAFTCSCSYTNSTIFAEILLNKMKQLYETSKPLKLYNSPNTCCSYKSYKSYKSFCTEESLDSLKLLSFRDCVIGIFMIILLAIYLSYQY